MRGTLGRRRIATTALRCSCVARRSNWSRTPTPTAALRRIYDAFTRTRSDERGCNWRATIYSCSHSLKRVERAFCTTRRLLFKFAFFQLIESIVFNNATSRILHLLKLCCIIHYLATIEIAHRQYFECVENAGGKKIQIKSK